MKTSNAIAAALFSSLAAAVPLDKRAYATVTHTVLETVVVYTTIWDGQAPVVPQATSDGLFFEKPSHEVHSAAPATSTPVYTPPVNKPSPQPSTPAYTPPANTPSPQPTPSSVYTPPPVSTPPPAPEPSSVYTPPPAPASSAAAPSASAPSSGGGGSGQAYTGGSLTLNYYGGGNGACGKPIADTDMTAALGVSLFGASTYDPQTGLPTNQWCNKKIEVTYNGVTAEATIMDRCSGCDGPGLDATPSLYNKLTGGIGGGSGDRLQGMTWKVIG